MLWGYSKSVPSHHNLDCENGTPPKESYKVLLCIPDMENTV